ncbi:hypothetical protein DIPPA_23403 [Diplonema papillatum]|nr:hypothetical protein DIPPA_23403 [Diplonema papillatum]
MEIFVPLPPLPLSVVVAKCVEHAEESVVGDVLELRHAREASRDRHDAGVTWLDRVTSAPIDAPAAAAAAQRGLYVAYHENGSPIVSVESLGLQLAASDPRRPVSTCFVGNT